MTQKPVSWKTWLGIGFALGLATGVALAIGGVMVLAWAAGSVGQITEASREARVSSLITNLTTVRSQLLLYKTQHEEKFPAVDGGDFAAQMTQFTDIRGRTCVQETETFRYGPYLHGVPANPITDSDALEIVTNPTTAFRPPAMDGGWWFNTATGEFRANLTDEHRTDDGKPMSGL
jgi:general secretion pathway protein G